MKSKPSFHHLVGDRLSEQRHPRRGVKGEKPILTTMVPEIDPEHPNTIKLVAKKTPLVIPAGRRSKKTFV